jgi:hypothetical protein
MRIELPDPSLVVLIGASGSGTSTFWTASPWIRHYSDLQN